MPVIPATQEADTWTQEKEVAVSWDCTIARQPGQQKLKLDLKEKEKEKQMWHNLKYISNQDIFALANWGTY